MKLTARDAGRFFAKPDPQAAGLLIYGADAMRVALKRQDALAALLGENADEEMRLTRISGADVRKDPSQVIDALKATGFFPGPRAVLVEEAGDNLAATLRAALDDWQPGDAQLYVTAGQLAARSTLRKLFEGDARAYAVGLYDDPPSREEIETRLSAAGLSDVDRDAMTDLVVLSRELGPGDFRQTLEKLSLYKLDDGTPVTSADVAACAPGTYEAGIDDALNAVAESRAHDLGPVLRRLQAQGTNPTTLMIGAARHFRTLHAAAADPGGPAQGLSRVRPPVFGPRRDRMARQAQKWGIHKLEEALTILFDTDLTLRSAGQTAPGFALVERAFIRVAMLGTRS